MPAKVEMETGVGRHLRLCLSIRFSIYGVWLCMYARLILGKRVKFNDVCCLMIESRRAIFGLRSV